MHPTESQLAEAIASLNRAVATLQNTTKKDTAAIHTRLTWSRAEAKTAIAHLSSIAAHDTASPDDLAGALAAAVVATASLSAAIAIRTYIEEL
jgi:hypothetical protein